MSTELNVQKKKIYIATVQIAIESENTAEACDSISACLTENLMQANAIIDWQYLPEGEGKYPDPIFIGEYMPPFEEGELFQNIPKL